MASGLRSSSSPWLFSRQPLRPPWRGLPRSRRPARQGDYVPVKDLPQQETLPAAPLVMAAYAFVWAVLLVYVWSVWRRLLKVEHEVKDLSARLAAKPGAKG